MVRPEPLHEAERPRAEHDVVGESGLELREACGERTGGEPLVLLVGVDVDVEEAGGSLGEAEAPGGRRVPRVRADRGHLEGGQMADEGTPPAPVQAEQGDQVHAAQGDARDAIEVPAVGGCEPELAQGVGEQVGVHLSGPTVAVLLVLDLHHRRLRHAREPGDGEGVRIGLLQLVGRPVDGELPEVGRSTVLEEVPGDRRGAVGRQHRGDRLADGSRVDRDRSQLGTQSPDEAALELAAGREERGLPLPAVVDALEPLVGQFVTEVEGERLVVVGERVGRGRRRQAESPRCRDEGEEERLGERTPRRGEGGRTEAMDGLARPRGRRHPHGVPAGT